MRRRITLRVSPDYQYFLNSAYNMRLNPLHTIRI